MPLFFRLLHHIDAIEIVTQRILWSLLLILPILAWRGTLPVFRATFGNPRLVVALAGSALMIAINWLTYVWAVNDNHVVAASLGYYINPLVNVLLGTIFLKEKLGRLQWLAVAVAAIGVAILAAKAVDTLYISLTLALSFASYGLLRKRVAVGSLPGLTVEVLILAVPAIIAIALAPEARNGVSGEIGTNALLFGAGLWTAFPLLLFATAARRMAYSTLGFVQFLAPTLVFILGLTVLKEPLDPVKLVCFLIIWTAIAIFCLDLLLRTRAKRRPPPPA